jgi:hypothetical protein
MRTWKVSRRAPLVFSSVLVVLIWLWFTHDGLASYFSGDDLMNIYLAWQKPLLRLAGENVFFFSPGYRPFGNLVYRLLFEMAGFHPLPFRIACFALLFLNLYLAYRTASAIAGKETAVLTVLFACYNAGIDLYHDAGVIYDILCFTFYFAALGLYVGARCRKQYLTNAQLAWFLIFYICALDSKEMAVTLPFVLIAYEFFLGEPASGTVIRRWLTSALGTLMTLPYVFGKLSHSSPLIDNESYRLHISPSNYVAGLTHYFDLLTSVHPGTLTASICLLAIILAAVMALITRDRRLMFALAFVLITPLPIVFVALRGAYVMYIPLFGIALYLAVAIVKLRDALVGPRIEFATFAVCAAAVIAFHAARPWQPPVNPLIRSTVGQLSEIQPRVPSSSKILFFDDPFDKDDQWVLLFICRLYYGLPQLQVDRAKLMATKPDPAAMASYNLIFTYRDSQLLRLKP